MMKQKIYTEQAPQAIGPYSQAIQVDTSATGGKTVYFSGQIPLDPKTMQLVGDDFASQAKQVLTNLQSVSKAAGGNLNAIVKVTVYLIDLANFPVFNELMSQFFQEPYPARTTIQVSALPKEAQVEVEAIMVI